MKTKTPTRICIFFAAAKYDNSKSNIRMKLAALDRNIEKDVAMNEKNT